MHSSYSIVKNKNLRSFFLIHLIVTIICSAFALRVFPQSRLQNFIFGQILVWVSLISITFSVYLFFLKKNIALLVSVIVFKWPILIYVIYKMTEKIESEPLFLAFGFLPVLGTSLVWSFLQKE
jgi:hypothetical protein